MSSKIEIKSINSLKRDVLPGNIFQIKGCLILHGDEPQKGILNFSLVGTNLQKETLKIPLPTKEIHFNPNQESEILWEVNYPEDPRRFNFGGYLQWFLPSSNKSGIIFKNLFTAGSEYNIVIKDTRPVFEDARKESVSKFFVEIENQEIDRLSMNVKIIVRDENEDEILYLEKDVAINYHVKLLFNLDITLKHLTNYQFKTVLSVSGNKIKESDWKNIFPVVQKQDTPVPIILEIPGMDIVPGEEEKVYLESKEHILTDEIEDYNELKIIPLDSGDDLVKFKGRVVYGIKWNEELEKSPPLFEEFRNTLFSYIFFHDDRTRGIVTKEKKIWEANKLLINYFGTVLKNKFSDQPQKLGIFLDRITDLEETVQSVLVSTDEIMNKGFITASEYRNLFDMKKNYYINYLSLKSDSGILTEKEEHKIHSLIDFMDKEKTYLKNQFMEYLNKIKNLMEKRYKIADYNTNLELIGIPREMFTAPAETYTISGEIINNSRKNNLYFNVSVKLPKGFKLISPKENEFPFIAYKSQLVEINNFELRFRTGEILQHDEQESIVIAFKPKIFK